MEEKSRKTLRNYLENPEFQNERLTYDSESKNPIWFVSSRYNAIISIQDETSSLRGKLAGTNDQTISIGFRSYHPYADGFAGGSNLRLHLDDAEATEEDHKKQKERVEKYWSNLPFEKQRELVQFEFDMGGDVPEEDRKKYNIKE
jgi:hypothetical protein